MDVKEEFEKLKDDPELAKSLEEAIDRNADAGELAAILAAAGFDADSSEALVAEYQHRLGHDISSDDLDESQLKAVAGGTLHNCKMPAAEGMTDCEQIAIPR